MTIATRIFLNRWIQWIRQRKNSYYSKCEKRHT